MVRGAVGGAGAKDRVDRLVRRDAGLQGQRRRLVARIAFPAGQHVAALGLARGLDAQRRGGVQRHRELVECARRPLDQLQLQLRHPVAPAVRRDLAAVERELDQRLAVVRRVDLDRGGAPHHVGGERRRKLGWPERPHRIAHRGVRRHRQARHRGLDRARPLVAPEHGAGLRRPLGLEGLDQALAVLADAQREAAPAQTEVSGVEVGAAQALCPLPATLDRRAPAPVQGGRIAAERQLDLERVFALRGHRRGVALSLVHRLMCPIPVPGPAFECRPWPLFKKVFSNRQETDAPSSRAPAACRSCPHRFELMVAHPSPIELDRRRRPIT